MEPMGEREGSCVPQHAFRSMAVMLQCRMTPCRQFVTPGGSLSGLAVRACSTGSQCGLAELTPE